MGRKQVLLLCGGGGTEHEISLISAKYIQERLESLDKYDIHYVVIEKDGTRRDSNGKPCQLRKAGELVLGDREVQLSFAIPCVHGPPGETGHLPALFEMMELPFLGSGHEGSVLCFNKISTKLWLDALGIPNTPYIFLGKLDADSKQEARNFLKKYKDCFIKASNQGSSVGCFHAKNESDLLEGLNEAFQYSPWVLVEQTVQGRELEIAVYQHQDKLYVTNPGEIICPDKFYSYQEKYSQKSNTKTQVLAKGLSKVIIEEMKEYARRAFEGLKLRHLARVDFFLTKEGDVYLNEINTFPGHTSISMFPMMMENNGLSYPIFLEDIIEREAR